MADILNVLKAEHNALRKLFKELDRTTDRAVKKRQQLIQEIEANLLRTRSGKKPFSIPLSRSGRATMD